MMILSSFRIAKRRVYHVVIRGVTIHVTTGTAERFAGMDGTAVIASNTVYPEMIILIIIAVILAATLCVRRVGLDLIAQHIVSDEPINKDTITVVIMGKRSVNPTGMVLTNPVTIATCILTVIRME